MPQARINILVASPNAPAMDVYIQGSQTPVASGVSFSNAGSPGAFFGFGGSNSLSQLPYGTPVLEFRPAGTAFTEPPLFSSDPLTLVPGERMTLIVTGPMSAAASEGSFRVVPLVEGFGEPGPEAANTRLVNVAVDMPAVGIDLGNDGSIEVPSLQPATTPGAGGVTLPEGTPLQVGIVSTTGEPVTAFTVPALAEGTKVLLVNSGQSSGATAAAEGLSLLTINNTGSSSMVLQNPVVYALQAVPDAPALDVSSSGRKLADSLKFGQLSAAIQVPPGAYDLDFFEHTPGRGLPSGAPVARARTSTLEAGKSYLMLASGFLHRGSEAPGFSLLTYAESFAEAQDQVRVRVVHASPDAPALDVGPLTNQGLVPVAPPIQDLAYSQASAPEGLAVPAMPISLGVTNANSAVRQPVASFSIDLSPFQGSDLFLVAAGAFTPHAGEEGFRMVLVNTTKSPWAAQEVTPR